MILAPAFIATLALGSPSLKADRDWDVLTATASSRVKLAEAGRHLGTAKVNLAGIWLDGPKLIAVASTPASEPLTRAVRETFERPVDVEDFLLFLDDLVAADSPPTSAFLPAGRARAVGVLLHPTDVFRAGKNRRYAEAISVVPLDEPVAQLDLTPAADGSVVGPEWAMRYQQPHTQEERLEILAEYNPSFARRVESLIDQLRSQGAMAYVEATVRPRERGYLLYGSFLLSRATNEKAVLAHIKALNTYNKAWGLNVPIKWKHPDCWRATVAYARELADTFGVVYATRRGAKSSSHYDGSAADLFVVNLPRTLKLRAPSGAHATFDLSNPDESRDLSLTPRIIEWIEKHFAMSKLRRDYPHWSDTSRN